MNVILKEQLLEIMQDAQSKAESSPDLSAKDLIDDLAKSIGKLKCS